MVQQVLHFIRHAQGSDESLVTAKSCRDALFVHVQSGKHIILPGDKRLVSHLSASFGQCLLFQALYQSTRIENPHPSYKSQDERRRFDIRCFSVHAEALEAFLTFLVAGCSKRPQRQGVRRSMSGGVLLSYVDAKSIERNEAYESFSAACLT